MLLKDVIQRIKNGIITRTELLNELQRLDLIIDNMAREIIQSISSEITNRENELVKTFSKKLLDEKDKI